MNPDQQVIDHPVTITISFAFYSTNGTSYQVSTNVLLADTDLVTTATNKALATVLEAAKENGVI